MRHGEKRDRDIWLTVIVYRYESEFEKVQDVFELQVKSQLWLKWVEV